MFNLQNVRVGEKTYNYKVERERDQYKVILKF